MSARTKLVDKLEGVENFCARKYRIALILEENELTNFIKEDVPEPEEATAKAKYKDMVWAKMIIADSIKDHLISQVTSKKTPKEMFDALTRMYEGKNINRKMNIRTQLKSTRMQKGETIHDYFSKISQFMEQLEAIGDTLDEDDLIMTTLNGLTRPWDAFIQTICARKEKIQFDSLWKECVQEGGLYKLKGHSDASLTHSIESPCELWHRRLAHINYKALPYVSKIVTGLPDFKIDHEGVCKECAQGKNIKNHFPKSKSKTK
jgi:hypothetical protein